MTLAFARGRQREWQRLLKAKVRDWAKLSDEDKSAVRITMQYRDRQDMVERTLKDPAKKREPKNENPSMLDLAMDRAKALQRDKALGQIGVQGIGDPVPDWDRLFPRTREQTEEARTRHIGGTALVIHIGPSSGPALCGVTKGRVAADPTTVTLLKDRWCSRCWNRWARQRSAEVA